MDDKAPAYDGRGDDSVREPQAAPQEWSCVDYVDVNVTRDVSAENRRDPKEPEKGSDGLRRRFGEITGHDERVEDTKGTCQQMTFKDRRRAGDARGCGETRRATASMVLGVVGGTSITEEVKTWYTDKQTNRGWPGTAEGKINTAQGMAGDLVSNLDSEEKSAVAGILTRTVSGGEVVEVTAVTTTSVMANVCYDLEHPVAVPFGCVGFGTNIISVADGHVDAKLAYRIQGGLSYNVTPRVTAFVSGYYHQVLGEGEYDDIPVEQLRDDQSPEGRSKSYALARFKMAYVGAEMGVRFAF